MGGPPPWPSSFNSYYYQHGFNQYSGKPSDLGAQLQPQKRNPIISSWERLKTFLGQLRGRKEIKPPTITCPPSSRDKFNN
jgi:hypothetical protein